MSKSNRDYQDQLNYIPYHQLMDVITTDADFQYKEWESKVDDVVENFESML